MNNAPALLSINHLSVSFDTPRGQVRAVNDLSLQLSPGRTLAIVGESGSGKSVLSRAVLRLLPATTTRQSGAIVFDGQDLSQQSEDELRKLRGREIAMIFQDPMSSLNPVLTIGRQIGEVLQKHLGMDAAGSRARSAELLRSVGIASADMRLDEYPHQLSGGMRQRVMIAMALACKPRLMIADEPTTALDVTIQMQILVLLKRQQRETGMAMIFISHDLAAVSGVADDVAVMYAGRIVEQAPVADFFESRRMPYSEALLRARPSLLAQRGTRLESIPGRPPDLADLPSGCAFAARCASVQEDCRHQIPPLIQEHSRHGTRRHACLHPLDAPASTADKARERSS